MEQIFDSMPGEIFVLRNAGNTITHAKGSMVTSLEFCTCKLMTKLILVLGHTACMALSSAMCVESCAGKASDALVQGIRSASDGSKEISMEEAVELNIYHTMDCLLQYSSCIREKVQTGELEIRGAVYKCATGQVQFLQEAHAGPKVEVLRPVGLDRLATLRSLNPCDASTDLGRSAGATDEPQLATH